MKLHWLSALVLGLALSAQAAVDINLATEAELDGIKGIGPSTSAKILEARKRAPFKDWKDFILRVPGTGVSQARKYSAQGVTVNGLPFEAESLPPGAAPISPASPPRTKSGA